MLLRFSPGQHIWGSDRVQGKPARHASPARLYMPRTTSLRMFVTQQLSQKACQLQSTNPTGAEHRLPGQSTDKKNVIAEYRTLLRSAPHFGGPDELRNQFFDRRLRDLCDTPRRMLGGCL